MFRLLIGGLLLCFSCSCERTQNISSTTQTTSLLPKIAFIPFFDRSKNDLNWDISEELSDQIFERIKDQEKYILVKKKHLSKQHPLFSNPEKIKDTLTDFDLAIFLEIIEHQEILRDSSRHLEISLRLQVIDLQEGLEKAVFREVIRDSYYLPSSDLITQVAWKEDGYDVSPIGMAHLAFSKKVAKRLETCIPLHKKV